MRNAPQLLLKIKNLGGRGTGSENFGNLSVGVSKKGGKDHQRQMATINKTSGQKWKLFQKEVNRRRLPVSAAIWSQRFRKKCSCFVGAVWRKDPCHPTARKEQRPLRQREKLRKWEDEKREGGKKLLPPSQVNVPQELRVEGTKGGVNKSHSMKTAVMKTDAIVAKKQGITTCIIHVRDRKR